MKITMINNKKLIVRKVKEYQLSEEIGLRPIQIFGKIYSLRVFYKNINFIECNIENSTIKVSLPKKYKKISKESMTDILIDKMYSKIAEKELEHIMEKIRLMLKFAPEDYEIIEMKDCLAKCTKDKKILINSQIIKFRKETIEYIVLHEFCHLKYKNHTKSFYNLIEKYIPNYKSYEIKDIKY